MSGEEMADPYATIDDDVKQLADILVNYSTEVEEGDTVYIPFDPPAEDLALAVYEAVFDAGGHPVYRADHPRFERGMFYAADDEQLEHVPEYVETRTEETDVRISIRGPENAAALSDVPQERKQQRRKAASHLREEALDNTRWVGTAYWSRAFADTAGMSPDEAREFVIDACVKDWEEESTAYRELQDVVDAGEDVRIEGEETDITFSIGERNGVNRVGMLSDGTANMPGGEVFTAPDSETVDGHVYFDLPAFIDGAIVQGVYLEYDDGELIDYGAEQGEEVLNGKIETDDGSRYLGELGIGTNFAIDRPMKNILYDEKIGGTVHMAIGSAYTGNFAWEVDSDSIDVSLSGPEREAVVHQTQEKLENDAYDTTFVNSLSNPEREAARATKEEWEQLEAAAREQQNISAVHQDFVKDMGLDGDRPDHRLWIDDDLILENGSFVGVESLP